MGAIKVQIQDEIERRFRRVAMQQFGFAKGSLSLAAERAFDNYTKKAVSTENIKLRGLGTALRGALAHVKGKTSVELQHETSRMRAERAMKSVSGRKHIS